jgi:hypothetical protein
MDGSNEIHPHFNFCTPLFCLCFCSQRLYPALSIYLSIVFVYTVLYLLYFLPTLCIYDTTVGSYLSTDIYLPTTTPSIRCLAADPLLRASGTPCELFAPARFLTCLVLDLDV